MDAVLKSDLHFDEATEVLTHKLTQPSEDIILERNNELRKNPGSIQDLGAQKKGAGGTWGRQVACIPEIMFYAAIRKGFEMNHKDADHAARETQRFLATEKGRQCLIGAPGQKYHIVGGRND